jgi:hypothetical protein
MASNEYHMVTRWQVRGRISEVRAVLSEAVELPRWWPSVYLEAKELEPGDENGLGRVISLYTKGWLPYTLRWQFRVTDVRQDGFTLEAWGDFVGRGIWTFKQAGEITDIVYDWKIQADKPLLRRLSFLFKPVFSANHNWAMARGLESLVLELARRKASSPEEVARIPEPPGPTFSWLLPRSKSSPVVT